MQKMNFKMSSSIVGLVISLVSLPTLAIDPMQIARLVDESKSQVETLPHPTESHPSVFVAVSLSMPKSSLLRSAKDAKDAQIPLVFRGAITDQEKPYHTPLSHSTKIDQISGNEDHYHTPLKSGAEKDLGQAGKTGILTSKTDEKELKVKVEVTPKTMIETHGKHLLVHEMKHLEWLVETGVTVLIDPQLFEVYGIHKVPVMVVADPKTRHEGVKRANRVEGDVTLAYALRELEKELKVKINKESQRIDINSDIYNYNKNVIGQISVYLDRLGGRP